MRRPVFICALMLMLAIETASASLTAPQVAETLAEVPKPSDVQLSPDGGWVVYTVTRRSLARNDSGSEQLLQRIARNDEPLPPSVKLPENASAIRWCPDSKHLSMLLKQGSAPASFVRYEVETGKTVPIPLKDDPGATDSAMPRPRILEMPARYQWSPSGAFVAFLALVEAERGLDPARGVAQEPVRKLNPHNALFVLDVASGTISQLTPDSLWVSSKSNVSWSPDERALAVAVVPREQVAQVDGDLIVVDRTSRTVRSVVARPGMDSGPMWSPDGKWIAFSTHDRDPRDNPGVLAVIAASGGEITKFESDSLPMSGSLIRGWWSADSKTFQWIGSLDMAKHIGQANIRTKSAIVLPAPSGTLPLPYDTNRSISADGRWMVYTRESMTRPPEVFIVALDRSARPSGLPRQLTRLAPDFSLSQGVKNEAFSWRSQDGKFTIHGILLTPASAGAARQTSGRLPTLVYFEGGPGMVDRAFAAEGFNGALLMLAVRGYAVLIPNTRGRSGYGKAFMEAIRTEKARAQAPLADALAGVDLLIARGVTDPDRLGVLGHSYGGYLTAYTVTATNRFKGAVVHEGTINLFESAYVGYNRGTASELLVRDLFGIHDPYDPAERARMMAESPILNADRVRTPTLTSCGVRSHGKSDCQRWFNSLRRFGVPSAYFLYDEGHVYERPAAIVDDLTRTTEWLDYWVRGIPFPDAERAREYVAWEEKR